MAAFELDTILIFVYSTIAVAVIGYFIEGILTWHSSKTTTIQKRSDEFIDFSKKYYMPLASLVSNIGSETHPRYNKVRPIMLFFKVAKYLNFRKSLTDEGIVFFFPKYTQECEVMKRDETFYDAINFLIFNDDGEVIERVIKYYEKNPNILSFKEKIDTLPEYSAFESICKNEEIIGKLYNYSDALCNSINSGVTEEYKIWYKREFLKQRTIRNINENADKEMKLIEKLHNDVYNKQ